MNRPIRLIALSLVVLCLLQPTLASLDYLACVAVCPNGARLLPVGTSAGNGCRYNQNCATAFNYDAEALALCQVSSYQELASQISFTRYYFPTYSECEHYLSIIYRTEQFDVQATTASGTNTVAFGRRRRDGGSKQKDDDAKDAACTCNSIVEDILTPVLDYLPEDRDLSGTEAVCDAAADVILDRLKDNVCSRVPDKIPLSSVANDFCELIFDAVVEAAEPVTSKVISFCGTVLETLLDALGLTSQFDTFIQRLVQYKDHASELAGRVCGPSVCTGPTFSSCEAKADPRDAAKSVLISKVLTDSGICEVVEKVIEETSGCFPGSALVQVENGTAIPMSQLNINDRILTADGTYQRVFYFSHREAHVERTFLELRLGNTTAASALLVTDDHYVMTAEGALKTAGSIHRGDSLQLFDGSVALVTSVVNVREAGLFNPHVETLNNIVLDGVVVSSLTSSTTPWVSTAGLNILKMAGSVGLDVQTLGSACQKMAKPLLSAGSEFVV